MATETTHNGTSTSMVMAGPSTAMAPATDNRFALEPTTFEGAMHLAEVVVKSGMFGVTNAADAFVRISTGRSLGLTSTQALRGIKSIKGTPCISADLAMALSMSHPECEYFRTIETTPARATFETKRRGEPPVQLSFTMDDAKAAGLSSNDMYRKYPAQMLRARCIAGLARLVYPDRLHGLYTPDEIKAGTVMPDDIQDVEFTPDPPRAAPMPAREIAKAAAEVAEAATSPAHTSDLEDSYGSASTIDEIKAVDASVAALGLSKDDHRRARLVAARRAAVERVGK